MVNVGDMVKVDSSVDQDPTLGTRGLSSRYGYIQRVYQLIYSEAALVAFNDFSATIPTKYLKVVTPCAKHRELPPLLNETKR